MERWPVGPGQEGSVARHGDAGLTLAVEATHLAGDRRGIGRFARAVLPRLLTLGPELRLLLFTRHRRGVAPLAAAVASDPALRGGATVLGPGALPKAGADVVWYPWNVAVSAPSGAAVVVTMHDVAPLVLPDPRLGRWWKNLRWRLRYAATARRADLILTDSAFSAREIRRVLGVPGERIRVAPLAADDFPVPPPSADEPALSRLGVRAPFVLAVGAPEPRKNHAVLHGAMRRVLAGHPGLELVVAGPRRGPTPRPAPESWLVDIGFVSDEDLAVLYRRAVALVVPSTYEGFGLPALEAMRLGGAVVCARAASLPEVAGDAALWFDPGDEAELASALTRLLSDDVLRSRLRAAGLRRSARFAWGETARESLRAFADALGILRRREAAGPAGAEAAGTRLETVCGPA